MIFNSRYYCSDGLVGKLHSSHIMIPFSCPKVETGGELMEKIRQNIQECQSLLNRYGTSCLPGFSKRHKRKKGGGATMAFVGHNARGDRRNNGEIPPYWFLPYSLYPLYLLYRLYPLYLLYHNPLCPLYPPRYSRISL